VIPNELNFLTSRLNSLLPGRFAGEKENELPPPIEQVEQDELPRYLRAVR